MEQQDIVTPLLPNKDFRKRQGKKQDRTIQTPSAPPAGEVKESSSLKHERSTLKESEY